MRYHSILTMRLSIVLSIVSILTMQYQTMRYHAPAHEDDDGEVSEAGGEGGGLRVECLRCLKWTNKLLQPDFEA